MASITHLDKVIIVLSFIYKQDPILLREFLNDIQLSDYERRYIINRINDLPSYKVEVIQDVLKEFYDLTENDALFNINKDISGEIKQVAVRSDTSQSNMVNREEHPFFDGLSYQKLFDYLNRQGNDVKGLMCHMLPIDDLKKMFTVLDADSIKHYLEAYHHISPKNQRYLDKFRHFLIKKIRSEGDNQSQGSEDKESQFIQLLEMLDYDAFNKIEHIEINQRKIVDYKPYFMQPSDLIQFSQAHQKIILDKLLEKELLAQILTLLPEQTISELLSLLTPRNQAIVKDDMDMYKDKLDETKQDSLQFEFIKLVRQLQNSGTIDASVKNTSSNTMSQPEQAQRHAESNTSDETNQESF